MKRAIFLAVLILTFLSESQAQNREELAQYVASDSSVMWIVQAIPESESTFEIKAMGRAFRGKELARAAVITINNSYGVIVAPGMEKEFSELNQVSVSKRITVERPGVYTISGFLSWYVKGDKEIKKYKFTLSFRR